MEKRVFKEVKAAVSSESSLVEANVKQIKELVRGNPEAGPGVAWSAILKHMRENHITRRQRAILLCDVLFQRSQKFRAHVMGDIDEVQELLFGSLHNPLPRSKAAEDLHRVGLRILQSWERGFGDRLHRLSIAVQYAAAKAESSEASSSFSSRGASGQPWSSDQCQDQAAAAQQSTRSDDPERSNAKDRARWETAQVQVQADRELEAIAVNISVIESLLQSLLESALSSQPILSLFLPGAESAAVGQRASSPPARQDEEEEEEELQAHPSEGEGGQETWGEEGYADGGAIGSRRSQGGGDGGGRGSRSTRGGGSRSRYADGAQEAEGAPGDKLSILQRLGVWGSEYQVEVAPGRQSVQVASDSDQRRAALALASAVRVGRSVHLPRLCDWGAKLARAAAYEDPDPARTAATRRLAGRVAALIQRLEVASARCDALAIVAVEEGGGEEGLDGAEEMEDVGI